MVWGIPVLGFDILDMYAVFVIYSYFQMNSTFTTKKKKKKVIIKRKGKNRTLL